MNNSQLLYKIANLQHSIRLKEAENSNAVKANDGDAIRLSNETIILLRQDLSASVKQFNSLPPPSVSNNKIKHLKEIIRRLNFANIKALLGRK